MPGADATDAGIARALIALAAGIAAGVLLGAGLFTAPVAFRVLSGEPALAGRIAGNVFAWSYGTACVAALVALAAEFRLRATRVRRVALALGAVAAFELIVLTPLIAARGAGLGIPFAWLHGAASVLHLAALVLACLLAWRAVRAPATPA